ncbi:hypothetical protein ACOME3_002908 [Neoechinorhynchus agilis]
MDTISVIMTTPSARILDPLRQKCSEFTHPPPVQALCSHPSVTNQLLIAYRHSFIVLYDWCSDTVTKIFDLGIQDHPVSNCRTLTFDGTSFVSGHEDGSCLVWTECQDYGRMFMPYGPFPKSPITYLNVIPFRHQRLWLQIGGLPRPEYSDKHTLTIAFEDPSGNGLSVQAPHRHVAFEFSTRVMDVVIVKSPHERDRPLAVLVLLEEELIGIDLCTDNWPTFKLPYLWSLHCSPLTACACITLNNDQLSLVQSKGQTILSDTYSDRPWPLFNQSVSLESVHGSNEKVDVFVTGHADGSVCWWDVRNRQLQLRHMNSYLSISTMRLLTLRIYKIKFH